MSDFDQIRKLYLTDEFHQWLAETYGDYVSIEHDWRYEMDYHCDECRDHLGGQRFIETHDESVCETCVVEMFFKDKKDKQKMKMALVVGEKFFGPSNPIGKLTLIKGE